MPDRRDTGSRQTASRGGRWVGIVIGIVLVAALLGWIYGWYGGEEEVLLQTEQPEALEGEEAVVAPELEAEEVIAGEEDLEESLEGEVYDDVELGEPAGDLEEGIAPAEQGLVEEGGIDDDADIFEGETATGEEGVLEGEIGLGVADEPGLGGQDGLPQEDPVLGGEEPEAGIEQEAPLALEEDEGPEIIEVPVEEPEEAQ